MTEHPDALLRDAQLTQATPPTEPGRPETTAAAAGAIAETAVALARAIDADTLQIFTLGRFDVLLPSDTSQQRRPIWQTGKARVVLKRLLAASDGYLSREQLMESLWPEQTMTQAQDALRHSLSRLRRALEPNRSAYGESSYLGSDRGGVWLRLEAVLPTGAPRIWADYQHFEALAAIALRAWGPGRLTPDAQSIETARTCADEALVLYRGPFLAADRDVDWTHGRRLQYLSLWATLVRRRAELAVAEQHLDHAALLLGQLLHTDPEDEDAAARLMRIQAALGHRGEALRIFERLSALLTANMGTRPTLELQELACAIRAGESRQESRLLVRRRFSPA